MTSIQQKLIAWDIWSAEDKELVNLLIGRSGGKTTAEIIDIILEGPKNKNQIAKILNHDYKTISHHVDLMDRHNYLIAEKLENSTYYHPSKKLFKYLNEYKKLREYLFKDDE